MSESITNQAITGVKWSAVSKIYTTLVSVLQVAILTRFLSKDDFGLIGIAVLVNAFCSIFVDMGLTTAVMHEKNLSKQQISSFYWCNLFIGLLLTLIVSASSPFISLYYHRDELVGIISLTSLSIFIQSLSNLQRTIQQKNMNFRFMSIIDILSSSVAFVINVVLAINGYGVYCLVWAQIVSGTIVSAAYLLIALRKEKNIMFHFSFSEVREAMKIGVYQAGSSIVDFIAREMDSFVISSYMSLELFGIYSLCKNLTLRVYQVINPIITNVLTPVFSTIQEKKERLSEVYIKTVNILGYVNFPIYGIIAVAASSIVTILYGEPYREYSFVMSGLAIFYAFQSCNNPISSLLIATGRTDRGFIWTIFRIVFTYFYLRIASSLQLNVFVFLIAVSPLILAYPNWYIILRVISTVSFREAFMLLIRPLLICLPLMSLYFLDDCIKNPFVSVTIVLFIFAVGYFLLNKLFRAQLQDYIFVLLKNSIHKKR